MNCERRKQFSSFLPPLSVDGAYPPIHPAGQLPDSRPNQFRSNKFVFYSLFSYFCLTKSCYPRLRKSNFGNSAHFKRRPTLQLSRIPVSYQNINPDYSWVLRYEKPKWLTGLRSRRRATRRRIPRYGEYRPTSKRKNGGQFGFAIDESMNNPG